MDNITFFGNGEVKSIVLDETSTQELKETGYCMVNDPSTSETYFIIIIDDEQWYVTKSVDYADIKLYHGGR